MKTLVISGLLFIAFYCDAQQAVEVILDQKEMSNGINTAFVVDIPQADYKMVEAEWRNYVNDRPLGVWLDGAAKQVGNIFRSGDKKVSMDRLRIEKVKDELYLRAIVNEDLTQEKLDIYARIVQLDGACQLNAYFQFTDSIFINEQNVSKEMIQNLKNYVREFGVEAYREAVKLELKSAENELKDQEKELKKLESKRSGFEKAINKYETDISDAESELRLISGNLEKQNEKINELKNEKRQYNKKSPEYESVTEEIKSAEKGRKEIVADIKKQKNRITKFKSSIKSEEEKIRENLTQQYAQQKIIDEKTRNVEAVKAKLDNIK